MIILQFWGILHSLGPLDDGVFEELRPHNLIRHGPIPLIARKTPSDKLLDFGVLAEQVQLAVGAVV